MGDSDSTQDLIFDRNDVSIIEIPLHDYLFIKTDSVNKGFHQKIIYTNEFLILKNSIKLIINSKRVKSFYEEKHCAKFLYECIDDGQHDCSIIIDGKLEREFSFVVC